jgi:cell division septal protein FtsQ
MLLGESVYNFFLHEPFSLNKIEVVNNRLFEASEIIEMSGLKEKENNLLTISIQNLKDKLESNKAIDKVVIKRKTPHTVQIKIYEKIPKIIVQSNKQQYFVDSQGNVLDWPKEKIKEFLPLVKGVLIGEKNLQGEPIQDLANIVHIIDVYNQSELVKFPIIWIKQISSYEILLFVEQEKVIKVNSEDQLEGKFLQMQLVLADLEKKGKIFKSIDLRFNDIVVV